VNTLLRGIGFSVADALELEKSVPGTPDAHVPQKIRIFIERTSLKLGMKLSADRI
jgi:hypothetical protein